MSHSQGRAACVVTRLLGPLALAVLLVTAAPRAQARQGLYAGLGLARQTVSSGISGADTYTATPNEIRVGKPLGGSGVAFEGGFGLSDYVALDLLLNATNHDTTFDPGGGGAPQTYKATLSSVLFGVRLGVPLGDVAEVFTRAGLGGYELAYQNNNFASGVVADDARFSGRGYALGVGAELFFGQMGLQLSYTRNKADFKTVQSKNFGSSVNPALSPSIGSLALLLTYSLQ